MTVAASSGPGKPGSSSFGLLDAFLLALLGLFALWLRASTVHLKFFNINELLQLHVALQPSLGRAFTAMSQVAPHLPPLDFVLSFLLARFTPDLVHLRALPVIWGTGSVLLAYACGRLAGGRLMGWLWGLLLAGSGFHLHVSQTLRPFSLSLFLTLAAVFFFLRWLRGETGLKGYAASLAVLQLTYPYALFLGLANAAYVLWRERPRARAFALSLVPCLAVFSAWAALWSSAMVTGPKFAYPAADVLSFAVLRGVFYQFNQGPALATPLHCALFALGVFAGTRGLETRGQAAAGLLALGGLGLSVTALALVFRYFLDATHLIAALPVYLGFVAAGARAAAGWAAERLPKKSTINPAAAGAVLSGLLVVLAVPSVQDYLSRTFVRRLRVQAVTSHLMDKGAPGDVVIVSNPNLAATLLYYLDKAAFPKLSGIKIRAGFALLRLPEELRAGKLRVFTLCRFDPSSATIDRDGYRKLVEEADRTGASVWFVSLPLNYMPETPPFGSELGVARRDLSREVPGLFRRGPAEKKPDSRADPS